MRLYFGLRVFFVWVNLGLLLIASSCRISSMQEVLPGLTPIDTVFMQRHIRYLASDQLKGRNSPGPGLDSAAVYLSKELKKTKNLLLNSDGFQHFNLCSTDLGDSNFLRIICNGIEKEFKLKDDFTPFENTADTTVKADIVFAGYGITAPEFNYDDYQGIDVTGKVVLVFRNEPTVGDTLRIFSDAGAINYSMPDIKMENAIRHGATGMLIVNEPLQFKTLRSRGFPWPSLSKIIPREALSVSLCDEHRKRIPMIHVGTEIIKTLFGSVDSLRTIQKQLDSLRQPHSFEISAQVHVQSDITVFARRTQNVVAWIEGSDSILKNEILVVGAHYDHIGYKKSAKNETDTIYNGADDNASGTAGVLAVAAAFARMPVKPKRSVAFVAFAAEEKGLFGSSWFVNHSPFPDKKIIAMLNMDMIGRNADDLLWLIGTRESPDIARIVTRENSKTGFTLLTEKGTLIGGSDHYNFYKKDIPFMFFFSGFHDDYHQLTDHADKINYQKAARIARLVFLTAWRISNESRHYSVINF